MASDAVTKTRVRKVKSGHLAVTEATSPFAAASSPFGDDVSFPISPARLNWEHSLKVPTRLDSYAGRH